MRDLILGFILVIVGVFGAVKYSAIFFGFFTGGLFLLLYNLITKSSPAEQSRSPTLASIRVSSSSKNCPNCRKKIDVEADFCSHCGNKVTDK